MPDGQTPSAAAAEPKREPQPVTAGGSPAPASAAGSVAVIGGKAAVAKEVEKPAAPTDAEPVAPSLLARLLPWRRRAPKSGLGSVLTGSGGEALSPAEREMIERIVAFDTKRVDDVAIPRADIVGVDRQADLPDLLRTFSGAGHSRLPVYNGDLDDPVGMVHIKDLVGLLADPDRGERGAWAEADTETGAGDDQTASEHLIDTIVRPVLYVPPSMPITDLLLRMQARRVHMALVIDEFGGTDGLVTIEDLIEEIVGDIRDEHDEDAELVLRRTPTGRLDADARLELGDLEDRTGLTLKLDEEEADTIGGLVVSLAGRVPVRGEVIRHPGGFEFEVAEADPRRIRRVFIRTKRRRARAVSARVGEEGVEGEQAEQAVGGQAAEMANRQKTGTDA